MKHLIDKFDEFEKVEEKINPKAELRNRGDVVFPAESSKVKDNKDHFPINDASQARNALARAGQYDRVPNWFDGTLTELKEKIRNAVKRKFKSISGAHGFFPC